MNSWKEYFETLPDSEEYDDCVEMVVKSVATESDHNLLKKFNESTDLIHISQDALEENIQILHHFMVQGNSFMQDKVEYFALSGLNKEAAPVQISGKKTFHCSSTEKPVPPFSILMEAKNEEELSSLAPNEK